MLQGRRWPNCAARCCCGRQPSSPQHGQCVLAHSRACRQLMLQVAERVNNLEALDGMRRTALISAAVANQADTVEVLTAAGSNLDAQVSLLSTRRTWLGRAGRGNTPVLRGLIRGQVEARELLANVFRHRRPRGRVSWLGSRRHRAEVASARHLAGRRKRAVGRQAASRLKRRRTRRRVAARLGRHTQRLDAGRLCILPRHTGAASSALQRQRLGVAPDRRQVERSRRRRRRLRLGLLFAAAELLF